MKTFVSVYSLETTNTYACLLSWRQETQEDAPLDSIIAFPKLYLNSKAQASFYMQAEIKHVLLPHVLPHHDQLNKNLDGGTVMLIFLKTSQLILTHSLSRDETCHTTFLSFQGEEWCSKEKSPGEGKAKAEMGETDKTYLPRTEFSFSTITS